MCKVISTVLAHSKSSVCCNCYPQGWLPLVQRTVSLGLPWGSPPTPPPSHFYFFLSRFFLLQNPFSFGFLFKKGCKLFEEQKPRVILPTTVSPAPGLWPGT